MGAICLYGYRSVARDSAEADRSASRLALKSLDTGGISEWGSPGLEFSLDTAGESLGGELIGQDMGVESHGLHTVSIGWL